MKKAFCVLFVFLFFQEIIHAQSWRRVGGWGNALTGITWVNEEVGYISGNQVILKTIDGGLSWTEQEAPTKNRMLGLDFANENLGLMVGEQGQVYRTTNGGANWQLVNVNSTVRLKKVKFLTATRAYIVGDNGETYRSTNGGQSWARQNIGTTADLNSLFFANSDTGYVAAENGRIFRTFNGGNNWSISNTGQNRGLNDIYFVDGKTGYSVGNAGTILKTVDAGNNWERINSGTERNLLAVAFNRTNTNLGTITGENATLMRTTNAGLTFDGININNAETYVDASFRTTSNLVFAVGSNGFLISSTNSGQSWSLRLSGREIDFTGTQFRTATLGYIIGPNGRVFSTNNGGNTLVDRSRPLSITFNDLFFTTNAFGYIAGENGNILRTTNSGGNWTSLNPGTNDNINGLFFFNNNLGYAVGNEGFLAKTENAGVNWEKIEIGNSSFNFRSIAFFDQESGIVTGSGGFVAVLENGEWKRVSSGTNQNLNGLAILDEETAIAIGNNGTIIKTENKGNSWTSINTSFNQNLNALEFLDESVGFIAGERGLIIQTKDGGENWTRLVTSTFQDLTGISFGTLSNGFAVGEKGSLFNYDCQVPETPTVIFGENDICLSQQVYTVQEAVDLDTEFEWRVDGGTILEGQGTARIVVEWAIPGRNAVLVRGRNFCGNGGTTGLEVLVSTEPRMISEIEGEGAVCLESFMEYSVDDIPGTNFIWEVSGGLITEGQGSNSIVVRWININEQTVRVTPSNPCGNGEAFTKDILVQTPPQLPSVIEGPEMAGLTVEEYSVTNVADVNYQWRISGQGGRILDGQGTNSITVQWENEGDFTISVTPENGCDEGDTRTLSVNVNLITSIIERPFETESVSVYPNPSSGDFNLKLRGVSGIRKISIYNALGQTLNEVVPGDGEFEFKFDNMPKGLHTISIQTRDKEIFRKILVK
ncbi:MAG: T9SS C-terminal target domain-containing protein [Mongoliibacter sp.]|uniref:YCF48-related protein n=1 Tax=Mongoliibacter sp. TaxID=2022438 RepID=UPI0012F194CF|nr:YCF48-related protein [Mongoliibacter sp.]TVP51735.1 MAG: T9SS C-terminal target domain-containing protein [Mongoliibacter sp.]